MDIKSGYHPSAKDEDDSDDLPAGLVGLQNISNTCYMNSALQALSNVQPMTHYFLNCSDLVEHITERSAPSIKAGLARSYQRLICDIWDSNDIDYVTPRGILYSIRCVQPIFRGFQQHDTQEFLRCFMDQLHEELKEQSFNPTIENNANFMGDDKQKTKCTKKCIEDDHCLHSNSSSPCESEYETCDSDINDHSDVAGSKTYLNVSASGKRKSSRESASNYKSQIQPQESIRSIVSDIFDGKLLSTVQCLACERVSTREETFQDLSLPIPNRDYIPMPPRNQSKSTQSLSSVDLASSRSNEGWISWMLNIVRYLFWGPSVSLHDCMSSFFSADELKGDNMYSCEKCNKLRSGVKYSQILNLPEVLCIHLKRFRHDLSYSSKISSHVDFPLENFDMGPYLHPHCKSRVSLYNLVSVICHHGTVGSGHYTCIARNSYNNRWYEYDDHRVTEVSADKVQNCQAYVLFYRKHSPQMELLRAEASELSSSNPVYLSDIRFYVSREWLSRFGTFAEPGPINNWDILCPHGGLLQTKVELISRIAVPISQPLWDLLYRNFGGGPAINMLFECEICKQSFEELTRRQYYELAVFTKYNELDPAIKSPMAIYAISMDWLRKWQHFVRGFSYKEPGSITNGSIAALDDGAQTTSPMHNVRPGSDYAQITAPIWRFLHGIYGGGPEIILRESLAQEIEIVDQDEDNENNEGENNLSDTESNIGLCNIPDLCNCDADRTNKFEKGGGDEIEENKSSKMSGWSYRSSRNVPYNRKARVTMFRSGLKKKINRSRGTMKNADLFGAKGNYSQCPETQTEVENLPTSRQNIHSTENSCNRSYAIGKKQRKSLQNEKYKNRPKKTNGDRTDETRGSRSRNRTVET